MKNFNSAETRSSEEKVFNPDLRAEISPNEMNSELKNLNFDSRAEITCFDDKPDKFGNNFENDKFEGPEQETLEKKGGSYGELKAAGHGMNHEPPEEVHHMPSDYASPLERNDGPAIAMYYEDHRKTASCGNSREAREYREKQKDLITEGKFEEAMQMDIDDIHEKFGDKYDVAIQEMKDYYNSIKTV